MREVVYRYLEEEKSKEDKGKDLELGACPVCSGKSKEAF